MTPMQGERDVETAEIEVNNDPLARIKWFEICQQNLPGETDGLSRDNPLLVAADRGGKNDSKSIGSIRII